jgi:hypothetical protein
MYPTINNRGAYDAEQNHTGLCTRCDCYCNEQSGFRKSKAGVHYSLFFFNL